MGLPQLQQAEKFFPSPLTSVTATELLLLVIVKSNCVVVRDNSVQALTVAARIFHLMLV